MKRVNLSSGAKWESIVGYSRAVKIGDTIEVSGTVSTDHSGEIVGEGDEYLQTRFILMKLENTLGQLGAKLENVVRTRIYCTNIKNWEKIGKAHGEVFGEIRPVTSMIEVSNLIDDKYLVEIEATAVL
ncbi:RidA family protein [Lacihabitans soyangensis]|jgi:enamine deaminase RidA (YjgF/YER057c/UK114 family)|uniref:RidA family protein n=1 Tax=Lacihabitans soyangensis TaxID=869394 RepID=A0AAE3KQX0_9BACT|nr:RidA family protein [Lacihabitans soyangensis]MCP9761617.1 RidA family protein [Lacihabitans soyangensis]